MMAVGPEAVSINSTMLSYGGGGVHSSQIPFGAAVRPTWWTEARIESTLTVEFVANKLREDEHPQLHRPLSFGDGLTSATYLEFILDRARKLFLILSEIGAANKIFSIIDRSYDDTDLPIPLEVVEDLGLSSKGADKLDRKFYTKQYDFLLRELSGGEHIDYESVETVPLEYSYRLPSAQCLQNWVRVRLPKGSSDVLARRHIAMQRPDTGEGFPDDYFDDIATMKLIQHNHIIPIYASYTFRSAGYVLTPFVADHTLKTFLEDSRNVLSFRKLPKRQQQRLLLEWMHCLAEAVAYLHQHGFQHTAIRPSNILIDQANQIAFGEIGSLKAFQRDKKVDPVEVYNYGAPEAHLGERYVFMNSSSNRAIGTALFRKRSQDSKSSSDDSLEGSHDQHPHSPHGRKKAQPLSSVFNFAGLNGGLTRAENSIPPVDASSLRSAYSTNSQTSYAPTEKTDVFSLGCIFVEILTCLHKLKPTDLAKHVRSVRKAQKGLHAARFDSSYHANVPRVIAWLNNLETRSFDQSERLFRTIPNFTRLIRAMLSHDPDLRPGAAAVREHVQNILIQDGGIEEHDLHCGSKSYEWENQTPSDTDHSEKSLYESWSAPSLAEVRQSFLDAAPDESDFYHHALKERSITPTKTPTSVVHPFILPLDQPPPVPPKSSKRGTPPPNFSRRLPSWAEGAVAGL